MYGTWKRDRRKETRIFRTMTDNLALVLNPVSQKQGLNCRFGEKLEFCASKLF